MSWLARTIANSLKLDDDDDLQMDANDTSAAAAAAAGDPISPHKANSPDTHSNSQSDQSPRGVKEDLTELKKTLTRQFWGVASFLAPPPDSPPSPRDSSVVPIPKSPSPPGRPSPSPDSVDQEASDDEALIDGIRSDFAEISGRFRTGISKLSQNKTVWEFTKIASNFLQLGSEPESVDSDLIGNAVGVTEEVVAFARNIAMHPETWLDFPLSDNDDDSDDFELTDAQQDHALAIERLAPRLGALRIELCPGYMSEGFFWKIYFVLLHPRLSKQDAELLSTPQVIEARAELTLELQSRNKVKLESEPSASGSYMPEVTSPSREENLSVSPIDDLKSADKHGSLIRDTCSTDPSVVETDKHPAKIVEKSVVDEGPSRQTKNQHAYLGSSLRAFDNKYEDDADDWLKEETTEISEVGGTALPIQNDEDVSFSDLEEEDDDVPPSYKKATYASDTSTRDSRDWVQLGGSSDDSGRDSRDTKHTGKAAVREIEIKESNDWLNLDDIEKI
ncbi:hypothetical protein SAY87_028049 [Trapa incisa]|uniref:BSD domain-containing protein n=1 Tax=Trapa incisa TaxID=236973 RepID=A0AAN7QRP5_9MYRT|nr:hypothetical protein SAY87_028049 [Trapa incisa]